MATELEEVVDLTVAGEEPLGLPRRLEALHLPLSPPCRLVRDLGPVVQVPALPVLDPGRDLPLGRAIAGQLVPDMVAIQVASSGRRDGRPPCRPRGSPGRRPAAGP